MAIVFPLVALSTVATAVTLYYVAKDMLFERVRGAVIANLADALAACRVTNDEAGNMADTLRDPMQSSFQETAILLSGTTESVFAFDSNGTIRVHPQDALVGVDISGLRWYRTIRRARRGTMRYYWRDEWRIAAFGTCRTLNWHVVSSAVQPDLSRAIRRTAAYATLLALLGMAIAASSAVVFARWITQPLHALIRATERVRHGALDTRIAVNSGDEIGVLTGAFNVMTARLQRVVDDLHTRNQDLQREIGERRRAEQDLRDSEQRYALAQKVANIGSWEWHIPSGRLYWSEQIEPMFGFPHGHFDATYAAFLERVHPGDRERLMKAVAASINEGATYDIEHRIVWQDGRVRWMSEKGDVFRDEQGQVVRMLGIVRDITARKDQETEREALIRELAEKNAELERFAYTASHDLKTPLITIGGFLPYLEEDARSGKTELLEQDIARIREAVERMGRLLNELLEISRIGRVVAAFEHVSLVQLAREAAEMVRGRLSRQQVTVDIRPDLPTVYGERPRLLEVLANLIDNAAKFGADHVTVGMRRQDSRDIFYVADNGAGIAPAYVAQVFNLFEKLDPKTEGAGVGLAIVKRIIEFHGGRIWAESEGIGHGSTFCFTLHEESDDDQAGTPKTSG